MLASELITMLAEGVVRWGDLPVNVVTAGEVDDVGGLERDYFDEEQGPCINIVGAEADE